MRYRLLGPLAVTRDDAICELGSPKQRSVLALLLLERGRVVSTDRLCAAIWGDDQPSTAMAGLHAYISHLRRALRDPDSGTSPIVRQPPGYVLDVPVGEVDLAEFRSLVAHARADLDARRHHDALAATARALALHRGPLLADLADRDWVAAHEVGVTELDVECRETRIIALLATGQIAPAVEESVELRLRAPLRDRSWWLSMLALYRAGRSADALELLRRHTARLDEELGLEPGPEIRELQGAILRHDPSLASWPDRPDALGSSRPQAPTPVVARSEPVASVSPTALVGRVREIDIVDSIVNGSAAGASRWLVLLGPPGIGKTRLAQYAGARTTQRGGRVVWSRNPEETAPTWWTLRQIARGLDADPDDLLTVPDGADADTARFTIYERVQSVIDTASRAAPLTVIVDDVGWADPASVGCLTFLAGALVDAPVTVVLTLRDEALRGAVPRLLAAIARDGANRQVVVPALGHDDVAILADQVAEESLTDRERSHLADRTGGNPLFVSEYARLSRAERASGEIPVAVRSVLDRRLAALSEPAREVLRVASVIGDALDLRILTPVCDLDPQDVVLLLDEAADHRIITTTSDSGTYVFAHGLLRDEVLGSMQPSVRRRIHLRVADRLGEMRPDVDVVAQRARHVVAAGPLADPLTVVQACAAAADDAAARWSSDTAARWWREAIAAHDRLPADRQDTGLRDDLIMSLLRAEARAGRGQTVLDTAADHLTEAIDAGRVAAMGTLAAAVLRSGGSWPWMIPAEDPGPLMDILERARELTVADAAAQSSVLAALAVGHCYHPDPTVPAGFLDRARHLADELGDPGVRADVDAAFLLTYCAVPERSREILALVGTPVDSATRSSARSRVDSVIGHSIASIAALHLGDTALAEHHLRVGIDGSEKLRLPVVRAQLRWMESTLALWRGDLTRAQRHHEIAREVHEQTELYAAGSGMIALMSHGWERGELVDLGVGSDDPIRWLRAVVAAREDVGMVGVAAAGVAATAGDRVDRATAERLVDQWWHSRVPHMWTTLGTDALLAHVVADHGLVGHVDRFVAALMPFADGVAVIGHVGCAGPVALALARLHLTAGRVDEARDRARQAVEIGERTGGTPSVLRGRLLLAATDTDPGSRARAMAAIAAAAADAGMHGLVAAAQGAS
ncbi:BTAD domain-containing putative transcriptional regulator [Williamsia sp. M5A3_1d]